jgi:hypothetical protein
MAPGGRVNPPVFITTIFWRRIDCPGSKIPSGTSEIPSEME